MCASNINECDSSPCTNGGDCVDGINAFHCDCQNGYSGHQCQTETNECDSNPCQHGATCNDRLADYRCTCRNGYTGELTRGVYGERMVMDSGVGVDRGCRGWVYIVR